jgi:hypothetical protein
MYLNMSRYCWKVNWTPIMIILADVFYILIYHSDFFDKSAFWYLSK